MNSRHTKIAMVGLLTVASLVANAAGTRKANRQNIQSDTIGKCVNSDKYRIELANQANDFYGKRPFSRVVLVDSTNPNSYFIAMFDRLGIFSPTVTSSLDDNMIARFQKVLTGELVVCNADSTQLGKAQLNWILKYHQMNPQFSNGGKIP